MFKSRIIFFIFLAFVLVKQGQGQIVLRVVDEQQKPVPFALIRVSQLQPENGNAAPEAARTNNDGQAIVHLTGKCLVQVEAMDYSLSKDTLDLVPGKSFYITLKTLEITAPTTEITGTTTFDGVSRDKSVYQVKTITLERIQAQGAVNLKDVLTNEMNVRIKQDAVFGSGISLRGISGQNVKILVDGVPLIGRLDGNLDLSQINLANIEKIEIIEGPMSVIYGSDALGGIINLITKKGTKNRWEAGLNSYYESVGSYNTDGRLAFRSKKGISVQATGGRNFFDGWGPTGEYGRVLLWKPKEQYFADAMVGFNIKKSIHRYQSSFFNELLLSRGEPTVTPISAYALDEYYYTRRFNNALQSEFTLKNNAHLQFINSFSWYRRESIQKRRNMVTLEDIVVHDSASSTVDTSIFTLVNTRGIYSSRRDKKVFNFQAGYDINLDNGKGDRMQGHVNHIYDFAGYFIADIKPNLRWIVRPALRASYNTSYGAPVTPSLNIKYYINENSGFRASYARGFRAPSLKELYLFFVDQNHNIRPNDNLKAENSDNVSFSLYFTKKAQNYRINIEPSVYYNDIRNMISLAVVDTTTNLYNYVNIGRMSNGGGVFSASISDSTLSLTAGTGVVVYKNYIDRAGTTPYTSTPEYRLNASYKLRRLNMELSLFYKYNGKVPGYALDDKNNLVQTYVQGYSMADVSLTKTFLNKRITLVVGAKNLFNVGNIRYNVPSSAAHSGNGTSMSIGMGRSFFTNIRINLYSK